MYSMTENKSFCCNTCSLNYSTYKSLWTHNKLKHDGKLSVKSVFLKKDDNCKLFNCSKCTKVYRQKQTKDHHEKKCNGRISITAELNVYDKKITVLDKEIENTELLIKLQDLKNIEIAHKRDIFQSRGLYTNVSSNVTTETTDAVNAVATTVKTEHFIYMIREREFINDNVYKIGRSSMTNCTRTTRYPKGSQIISLNTCIDSIKFERILIQLFKFKFIQEREYGTEYFRGDIQEMKNEILKLLLDESKGYSDGENIASLQFKIENNKELKERKLPHKDILELKELLNEKIIALANKEWS